MLPKWSAPDVAVQQGRFRGLIRTKQPGMVQRSKNISPVLTGKLVYTGASRAPVFNSDLHDRLLTFP
jgi:hypothetical protein